MQLSEQAHPSWTHSHVFSLVFWLLSKGLSANRCACAASVKAKEKQQRYQTRSSCRFQQDPLNLRAFMLCSQAVLEQVSRLCSGHGANSTSFPFQDVTLPNSGHAGTTFEACRCSCQNYEFLYGRALEWRAPL